MKSLIELALSVMILAGGGKYALVELHDTVRELAVSKIQKGLSPTQKLNRKLWE